MAKVHGETNQEEIKFKIEKLRELVLEEDDLQVRTDDNFLLRYLRCCGYDPDKAFNRMKAYYELKRQHPNWFATDRSSTDLNESIEKGYFYMLPTKDRDGRFIYVNELGYIQAKSSMSQESQLHDFYTETMLDDDATQKNGLCVIIDLKNVSWKLVKWLTPANLRVAVKKTETLPVRHMTYHVVNPSAILSIALKIILPFLSNVTKENIHVHDGSWSSLHKMIDPNSLPSSYGGMLDSTKHKVKLNKHSETLLETHLEQWKRVGKLSEAAT